MDFLLVGLAALVFLLLPFVGFGVFVLMWVKNKTRARARIITIFAAVTTAVWLLIVWRSERPWIDTAALALEDFLYFFLLWAVLVYVWDRLRGSKANGVGA